MRYVMIVHLFNRLGVVKVEKV